MAAPRRSSRRKSSDGIPSGSEYHESEKSIDLDPVQEEQFQPEPPVEYATTKRGRLVAKRSYIESSDGDDLDLIPVQQQHQQQEQEQLPRIDLSEDDDMGAPLRRRLRPRKVSRSESPHPKHDDFIASEDELLGNVRRYSTRSRSKKPGTNNANKQQLNGSKSSQPTGPSQRTRRLTRRNATRASQEEDYVEHTSSAGSADADGSLDDTLQTSDLDVEPEPEPSQQHEPDQEDDNGDGKPYALRQRARLNYAIPPAIEEMAKPPPKHAGGRAGGGRSGHHAHGKSKGRSLGWSASGAELGRWMGMPGDDSDSDYGNTRTPRKPFGGIAPFGAGGAGAGGGAVAGPAGAGGMFAGDLAAGGTPSNLGKIGDSALADADPLGVNTNVTFDEVGGLDDHIHSLKEMTLLPLLYPEVFQKFKVTPPRGVLFHGPPGTGKTLLARALAASCRTNGKQISFFMRKGADCLSKWVGEAERQLRLLFEEARACQPSIIFFDEIDGLAPVRSSKQDQIHASIVSTLLALMDGMDGRGQVVVIGATNRPDAVDPALRRPGRFDREFYFGLPGEKAREKILEIMTRDWDGWGEGGGDAGERVKGLARLTKGYGGADLRALCTEATLNAIQRRYPQIYKSTDRLLLKPDTISVGLRDFMISIKKLVPSSARSSSSSALPLPVQFVPILNEALDQVKASIERVMPVEKKLSALEEAEFEDEGGEEGALEREMVLQSMQTLRVYRPRVVIHGPVGMGQGYVAAAALHHLEGYHVQSLELGTLMSDSTRTIEAAIVQLFVEAKRHQPSVIYIPSLIGWCAAVSETSRSTVRAMLDTLSPTDPILLLAIVDGPFASLPRDVKAWFGPTKDTRVTLNAPDATHRELFFQPLIKDVRRPPNEFADGVKRRKRVLEELPVAPPLEPRKPTAAELAVQEENDQRVITLLKYRLGPILTELKRKFKRFTKRASEEYQFDFSMEAPLLETNTMMEVDQQVPQQQQEQLPNGIIDITEDQQQPSIHPVVVNGHIAATTTISTTITINGDVPATLPSPTPAPEPQQPQLYDIDLERMHVDLYKERYITPQDFLDDVAKIVHNASIRAYEDQDRFYKAQAMLTATQVSIQEFDPQLKMECERMAVRERQRREERRKGKGKGKGAGDAAGVNGGGGQNGNGNGNVAARRSTRNNGQKLDISISDPVLLERRLKRQRGEGSQGSEEEVALNVSDTAADEREAKRTRIVVDEEEDERDPLDLVGTTPPSQIRPHATHSVRFAVEPMRPLVDSPVQGQGQGQGQGHEEMYQRQDGVASNQTHHHHHDDMIVDVVPRRSMGFDPSLLNPVQSGEGPPYTNSASPSFGGGVGSSFGGAGPSFGGAAESSYPNVMSLYPGANPYPITGPSYTPPREFAFHSDPSNPFITQPFPPMQVPQQSQQPHHQLPHPFSQSQTLKARTPSPLPPIIRTPEPVPTKLPTPPPIIERTPTPPLPDFHLQDDLVQELQRHLRDDTSSLNVEQLEQLRATCLGNVWRHRTEWDRDPLVRELLGVVKEFVDEVKDDSMGDADD